MFRFQQFTIHDDRCAMKVGTDGVLLGAWAALPDEMRRNTAVPAMPQPRVLDVGTGSGLVALMLAQRFPEAQITGLELDADATQQAIENIQASPFVHQIRVLQGDFRSTQCAGTLFDVIVSNPPYFEETLPSPNAQRAQARHVHHGLTFEALTTRCAQLLRSGGWLQVIIPKSAQSRFVRCAQDAEFTLIHQTDIQTVARKPPKRVMLRFELHHVANRNRQSSGKSNKESDVVQGDFASKDTLVLLENGQRTPQYNELCQDFYLTKEQLSPK